MTIHNPEEALQSVRREFGEHGGVTPSISRSSTFTVMEPGAMPKIFSGVRGPDQGGCFLYSRQFNPTVDVLGRYIAAMEGTETAICAASGMAAISCALLQLVRSGNHIVASDTIYGGTHALLEDLLGELGIQTTFVDITDLAAVEEAISAETKVLFTETIGNPTLKVADIPSLARISRQAGIQLVVDNTFSPVMISPAVLGADVVVYSMTKFINGASDLLAGVICGSRNFIRRLMDLHTGRIMLLGPTMDPRVAFDVIQRLPHLPLRMREHGRRALAVSEMLADTGLRVIYPGLSSHPQHKLLRSILNGDFGYGGIFALDCGTQQKAEQMLDILQNQKRFGMIAVSLGYFDTLMSCSGSSTSSEISKEEQDKIGLSPGLLRISIGFTDSLESRLRQMREAVQEAGLLVSGNIA